MSNLKLKFTLIVFILYLLINVKCLANDFVGFQAFPANLRMMQGIPQKQDVHQPEVSLIKCGLICAEDDTCTSINYNDVRMICEKNMLKMKSREYRIQQETGWKLYEKLPCGLGYMNGTRCRHIQNLFQYEAIVTYQMAADFCYLLGDSFITLENEQDKVYLESDADRAEMFETAYIWLYTSDRSSGCRCYRREFGDIFNRDCDKNAAVVCERP